MELYVYDNDLNVLDVVDSDTVLSCMWTMCYDEAGSFELYLPATPRYVNLFKPLRYIYRADVDEAMYIDTLIEDHDNGETSGKTITVSGYSLDKLLSKRIIRRLPSTGDRYLENVMNTVLAENPLPLMTVNDVGSGLIPDAMKNVEIIGSNLEDFVRSTLASFEKMREYGPDVDAYKDLCRVRLLPTEKKLLFETYASRNMSKQIIFSDYYDNLRNCQYEYSEKGCCTSVYVATKLPNIDGVLNATPIDDRVKQYDAQIQSWENVCNEILAEYGGDTAKAYAESESYRESLATLRRLREEREEYIKNLPNYGNGVPEYSFGPQGALEGYEKYVEIPTVVRYSYTDSNGTDHYYIDYDASWTNARAKSNELIDKISENYNGEVSSREYRTLFRVGDIVSIRDNQREMTYAKRIIKVEENWDASTGYTVKPVFGEPLKTVYDLIDGKTSGGSSISLSGGSSGGSSSNATVDYSKLSNRPYINGVELIGDRSFEDLGENELSATDTINIWNSIFNNN